MDRTEVLPTQNEDWGFWGTWQTNGEVMPVARAWHVVSRHLATYATPKRTAEGAREWLDSRMGRHFADYLTDAINGGLTIHKALVTDMARSHIVRRHDAPFGGR